MVFCFLLSVSGIHAQTSMMDVTSSSNGQGAFTITFSHTNYPWNWKISSNEFVGSGFYMQFRGITNTVLPPGWTQIEMSNGLMQWTYTNGTFSLENTSVSFVVQSVWTNAALHTNALDSKYYSEGLLMAAACCNTCSFHWCAVGYQKFYHMGPALPLFFDARAYTNTFELRVCDTYGQTVYLERAISAGSEDWVAVTNFPPVSGCTNLTLPWDDAFSPVFWRFRSTPYL